MMTTHGFLAVAATVDLVHNEFCMRNLFLQTKMVVGRKGIVIGCCSSSAIFGDITVLIYH